MYRFERILQPCNVRLINECKSRKSALESASQVLSQSNESLSERDLLERFVAREELGSTALDDSGVAIPHCRTERCTKPTAAMLRVDPPVQFGLGENVRIIIALVVPVEQTSTHLQFLKTVALVCRQPSNVTCLLQAKTEIDLHRTFMHFVDMAETV